MAEEILWPVHQRRYIYCTIYNIHILNSILNVSSASKIASKARKLIIYWLWKFCAPLWLRYAMRVSNRIYYKLPCACCEVTLSAFLREEASGLVSCCCGHFSFPYREMSKVTQTLSRVQHFSSSHYGCFQTYTEGLPLPWRSPEGL